MLKYMQAERCCKETQQAKGNMYEVLVDDRRKLGMDSSDPHICSEWRLL